METDGELRYYNKSAYVSLMCLIAFVVVISICLFKQFIWDSLLSKHFRTFRDLLGESIRKISPIYSRSEQHVTLNSTLKNSSSDIHLENNESTLLSSINGMQTSQFSISRDRSSTSKDTSPHRSYGSSLNNPYAYINYGSEE